ncbi:MAG: dicarboxylate/amino acid:cation symporter [Clostridia bacterium]|nr:dicarboxylate/amino acid:cation symporter [Clostridia bacterium]
MLAIAVGMIAGFFLPEGAMQVVVTVKYILGQIINFCVPLIVIGFIAPSITQMGSGATKMLTVAVAAAYISSLLAALLLMGAGYAIIPHLSIANDMDNLRQLPDVAFQLDIPQIMPVMSALAVSVLIGLAAVWTKAKTVTAVLQEFQAIVLSIVKRIVIPILPFFIAATFCTLAWEGTISQLPVFLIVILVVLVGHYIWLAVLYGFASLYSRKSGLEVLSHYGPAYLTAVGTMSSAATLGVALECARKSKNLRRDIVDFGIPLFANIHLCGSVLTEVFFVMTVSRILYGSIPTPEKMILFCFLLGVFAIGAPGVPGGTVMASLGLIIGVFGFDSDGTALMLAVFALQDSFGTACNVPGDGALTRFRTGFAEKHGVREVSTSLEDSAESCMKE